MNTLHEHLREMLLAIDEQVKIPNTKLHGGCWIDYYGINCTMCAAGAWFAQKFGRRDIVDPDHLDTPVRYAMIIMDSLRRFAVGQAYYRLYHRYLEIDVPYDIAGGNTLTMDVSWRASQEKLLIWLTEQNL